MCDTMAHHIPPQGDNCKTMAECRANIATRDGGGGAGGLRGGAGDDGGAAGAGVVGALGGGADDYGTTYPSMPRTFDELHGCLSSKDCMVFQVDPTIPWGNDGAAREEGKQYSSRLLRTLRK